MNYLFEICSEEIPARFIPIATDYVKERLESKLSSMHLNFSKVEVGGTPRRIYAIIDGLPSVQEDRVDIVMGPPANIAFNEDGSLKEVGLKFAESKGLDIASLKKVSTEKGEYLQGEKKVSGKPLSDIILEIMPEIVSTIPWPKSMKWGSLDYRFARPIHSMISLLDNNILPFSVANIEAGRNTLGHRFLSSSNITIDTIEGYKESLEKAFIIADRKKRAELIEESFKRLEKEHNIVIDRDEELLETVINIVEYPHGIMGSFAESFLALPEQVLITSMKVHQKYFPVRDKNGKLLNHFIGIANIAPAKGDDIIRKGYERVLRARLNDALFFFNNDKREKLENKVEGLKKVVYQEKLGTIYEKMDRFKALSSFIAEKLSLSSNECEAIQRVAFLSKADLLSEMVYEFPELQGEMGYFYALSSGESETVAKGIMEHYMPRFAKDALPQTVAGKVVSIADKLDTITSVFAIGLKPTGNLDPYALRRCAIGIISIILDAAYRLNLRELIDFILNRLSHLKFNSAEVRSQVEDFIFARLKQQLISMNISQDIFDAVLSGSVAESFDIYQIANLVASISEVRNDEDFLKICAAYKRINNILKKNEAKANSYDHALFEKEVEKELAEKLEACKIEEFLHAEEYIKVEKELLDFAPTVDKFFTDVMVMAEDMALRNNRLALISSLREIFLLVGDLSKIAVL